MSSRKVLTLGTLATLAAMVSLVVAGRALADVSIAGLNFMEQTTAVLEVSETYVSPSSTSVSSAQNTYGFDLPSAVPSGYTLESAADITVLDDITTIRVSWIDATADQNRIVLFIAKSTDATSIEVGTGSTSSITINGHSVASTAGGWDTAGSWDTNGRVLYSWRSGNDNYSISGPGAIAGSIQSMIASMPAFQ